MYDWVHKQRFNFIGGECPHQCKYCYVKSMNYPAVKERYSGKIRLLESEFKKPMKADKPIFVGSCFDMFADAVPDEMIRKVLNKLDANNNKYLFQTKNPGRYHNYNFHNLPKDILGTTIETDDFSLISRFTNAVHPRKRAETLSLFISNEKMITIEPIMEFHLKGLVEIIEIAQPTFVNIGADSKRHNLPEPSWDKVQALIAELSKFTTVKCKSNLDRLKK